jgi:DNA-binding protein H-NS
MAKQLRTMDTEKLLEMREQIDQMLNTRRSDLESQLRAFDVTADLRKPTKRQAKKKKVARKYRYEPKYQSKQDRSLKWTGQGQMPRWLREEIAASRGKLKKDDFLIR